MKKKVLLPLIVLALAGAGLLVLRQQQLWIFKPAASDTLILSGNIEAHESILSFKSVQSRIVKLPFNEGQWVSKGTVVAAVDDTDYRQQVAIAEANQTIQQRQLDTSKVNVEAAEKTIVADRAQLDQRKLDLNRSLDLAKQGFLSPASLDQTKTALRLAQASLDRDIALRAVAERNINSSQAAVKNSEESLALARIVQGYAVMTAPFDGVVTVRQAELGELVVPGTPVLSIADLDHIWLRAYLNETDLGKVRLGQEVTVKTDSYPNKRYQGRISFIASKAEFTPKSVETHEERVTLVYRVKIDIDNRTHELLPGMPADAIIGLHAQAAPQ